MRFSRATIVRRFGEAVAAQYADETGTIELSIEQVRALRLASKRRGLGDLVAAVAQPIARAIDAAAGTKLAECGGCKKRREALNRIHL